MSDSRPKPERPTPDPKALTTEYHKARKQLVLWAAILFMWELVGIDLVEAKKAGGTAGAIVGAIKSPQAVPWAILIIVGYFAFKLRIEWRQCTESRRCVREAKQDYYSACIIAGLACCLFAAQTISHVQLANAIQSSSRGGSLLGGFFLGFFITDFTHLLWDLHVRAMKLNKPLRVLSILTISLGIFLVSFWSGGRSLPWLTIGLIVGLLTGLVVYDSDRLTKRADNR